MFQVTDCFYRLESLNFSQKNTCAGYVLSLFSRITGTITGQYNTVPFNTAEQSYSLFTVRQIAHTVSAQLIDEKYVLCICSTN